jgi:hypothetical protein
MNPAEPELQVCDIVQVNWSDRWQVYRRLQELEIPCWCAVDQPLRVKVDTPKQVAQLGSVLRQFCAQRRELVQLLERCWEIAYKA